MRTPIDEMLLLVRNASASAEKAVQDAYTDYKIKQAQADLLKRTKESLERIAEKDVVK